MVDMSLIYPPTKRFCSLEMVDVSEWYSTTFPPLWRNCIAFFSAVCWLSYRMILVGMMTAGSF